MYMETLVSNGIFSYFKTCSRRAANRLGRSTRCIRSDHQSACKILKNTVSVTSVPFLLFVPIGSVYVKRSAEAIGIEFRLAYT